MTATWGVVCCLRTSNNKLRGGGWSDDAGVERGRGWSDDAESDDGGLGSLLLVCGREFSVAIHAAVPVPQDGRTAGMRGVRHVGGRGEGRVGTHRFQQLGQRRITLRDGREAQADAFSLSVDAQIESIRLGPSPRGGKSNTASWAEGWSATVRARLVGSLILPMSPSSSYSPSPVYQGAEKATCTLANEDATMVVRATMHEAGMLLRPFCAACWVGPARHAPPPWGRGARSQEEQRTRKSSSDSTNAVAICSMLRHTPCSKAIKQ